jgi:hypothetical protein
LINAAQTLELPGDAFAVVVSVPDPVPAVSPKPQPSTGVPIPTESTPVATAEIAMDLTVNAAQTLKPLGDAPAVVNSVSEPVPAVSPKPQPSTGVQIPTESTPVATAEIAMDLTGDQDDVVPMTSGDVPADGIPVASTCPPGMSYYFLVFFFSSHHSFLIRHVAPSHVPVFPNMVLLI